MKVTVPDMYEGLREGEERIKDTQVSDLVD